MELRRRGLGSRRLRGSAVLFLVAAVSGCVGLAPGSPSRTPGRSPVPGDLTPEDLARGLEALRLIRDFGALAWPGWTRAPPLLLRKGEYDYLVGHATPPEGFEPLAGNETDGVRLARRAGHLLPVPAATAWEVAGTWCIAIPTLDEYQAAIDAHLGRAVVTLTEGSYVRAAVHEGFHAYQMACMGGPEHLPAFVRAGGEDEALASLSSMPDLDARHRALGQALRAAIEAGTEEEARGGAARYLALRAQGKPETDGVADYERGLEWTEGTARYAERRVTMLARKAREPDADAVLPELYAQLSDPAALCPELRDRYASFGAGEALLLDRLEPGWHAKAIPGGSALDELLSQVVEQGPRS